MCSASSRHRSVMTFRRKAGGISLGFGLRLQSDVDIAKTPTLLPVRGYRTDPPLSTVTGWRCAAHGRVSHGRVRPVAAVDRRRCDRSRGAHRHPGRSAQTRQAALRTARAQPRRPGRAVIPRRPAGSAFVARTASLIRLRRHHVDRAGADRAGARGGRGHGPRLSLPSGPARPLRRGFRCRGPPRGSSGANLGLSLR